MKLDLQREAALEDGGAQARRIKVAKEILEVEKELLKVRRAQEAALGLGEGGRVESIQEVSVTASRRDTGPLEKFERDLRRRAEAITQEFEPVEATIARRLAEIDDLIARDFISEETAETARKRIRELAFAGIEEIEVNVKKLPPLVDDSMKQLEAVADQAARNMQDAFADFLFDPFSQGLDGMLRGFIDVLRRMAAEAAAAKIFGSLFGGGSSDNGGGLGKFFRNLVKFQTGGTFEVGGSGGPDSQLVAFRASPNERVTVTPPGKGPTPRITINQPINFQGDRNDLPLFQSLLQSNNEALEARLVERLRLEAYS